MMEGFGKAKFGGNTRNWWKLKDGTNGPYRIVGPIADNAEEGRWSYYCKLHYGYKNSEGKMRTFESPEVRNRKTKMVDVKDAALERINALKKKLDEAKAAGNAELVEQLLKLVGGKKSRFNLDANHYMNVIDLQGNIGILKIRHRAWLALKAKIDELRAQGIEPLDPDTGRFFLFHRSGNGNDTVYQVSIYKRKLNIEGVGEVEQDVVHVITPDIARRLFTKNKDGSYNYKEAIRLDTYFKKPTAAEVERIVNEGEKAVDEILDAKGGDETEDTSGIEGEEELTGTPAIVDSTSTTNNVMVNPSTPQPVTTTSISQSAPVSATSAPVTQFKTTQEPVVTTAESVSVMSDEEFLKKFLTM